tara:strand:+ start:4819 stop:6099 length:1281 start_codon:yes stop_codon:yes gene_type:complete
MNLKDSYKSLYGEVPTPSSLINDMLNLLPIHFYKKKNLKYLDPGCGNGAFSLELLSRLKPYHNNAINNIYLCEINSIYKDSLQSLFKFNNIYITNYLNWNSPYSYDLILGNPPFNFKGLKKTPTNNQINKKKDGETIWPEFIKKSISLLNPNGYLLFITPAIWLKPDKAKIFHFINQYKIHYMYPLSSSQISILFERNAQTPCVYFLLEKTQPLPSFQLFDHDQKKYVLFPFSISENLPIPMRCIRIIILLKEMCKKYGSLKIKKTNLPPKNSEISPHKSKYYCFCNIKTTHLIHKKPILIYEYSHKPLPYYGIPKVVFPHKMLGMPFLDSDGKYGISNRDCYIYESNSKNNLERILNWFQTPEMLYLYDATRYRMRYLEKYIFEFIPNITNLPIHINRLTDLIPFRDYEKNIINSIQSKYNFDYE